MSVEEKLVSVFKDEILEVNERFIKVKSERLREIMVFLRDLKFDFLMSISGVDYPKENLIQIVYHLYSYENRKSLVIKIDLDRSVPKTSSIETVWGNGQWLERETFDLFGVIFEGNTDLKRLLLPLDWEGYPLRKDYEEPEIYHGIETFRENPLNYAI